MNWIEDPYLDAPEREAEGRPIEWVQMPDTTYDGVRYRITGLHPEGL